MASFYFHNKNLNMERRIHTLQLWKLFNMLSYKLSVAEIAISQKSALVDYVIDAHLGDKKGNHRRVKNRYIASLIKRNGSWLLEDINLRNALLRQKSIDHELYNPVISEVNRDNQTIAMKLGTISDNVRKLALAHPAFTPAPKPEITPNTQLLINIMILIPQSILTITTITDASSQKKNTPQRCVHGITAEKKSHIDITC